ncbi:MAG: response regulator transcription factor [Pseudomonadota bacterium]|nr:response regulator transcription factor [Pseudomonadota bacterium]
MTVSIRILLVDDHAVVREGVRALLEDFDDMSVVGEAPNGDQALEMLPRVAPDLMMTDLKMPGVPVTDLVRQARALLPSMRILMFTSFAEGRLVRALLDAGADGYLLKDAHREEIRRAIHSVMSGRTYLHVDAQTALDESVGKGPLGKLTDRERAVLALIAEGKSNKEIGRALDLTEGTVKGYVSAIFDKLNVSDRTQAAMLAHRSGLV